MKEITRRELLDYSWKSFVLFAVGAATSACGSTESVLPTPDRIPTVNPLDPSPYRDLARFYPALDSLPINGEPMQLATTVPTTIYNFTQNRKVNQDPIENVFDYFESLAISNKSIDYSFQMFDRSSIEITKRPVVERSFVLVPSDGPNLSTNSLSEADKVAAVTLIDDEDPEKIKTYTFIKLVDVLNADQSKDPSDFRKFVTEVCQSTIFVRLNTDISAHQMAYQNLSQEILCNSISVEIEDRHKNILYDDHARSLKGMGFAGFPIIISSQKDYLLTPQLGDVIK